MDLNLPFLFSPMQKDFPVLEAGHTLDVVTDLLGFLEDVIFFTENKIKN